MSSHPGPPPNDQTFLVLSVLGVPKYSARGLTQTLGPIDASKDLRRSINGQLMDLSHPQFRKYQTKITCTDTNAPALDGIFPGLTVVVDCVCELAYPAGGTPQRVVVPGSSRLENGYYFYRPRLTMMVMSVSLEIEEWGAHTPWEIDMEEQ